MRALSTVRLGVAALVSAVGFARVAWSQCPDGTPRPCAGDRPPSRLAAPAIDDNAWIVAPFANTAQDTAIDWLRNGSISILATYLGRWNDVRVVDERRVLDLVRTVSPRSAATLSLADGLAIARRAGAGNLIMGTVLKVGPRSIVTATVYRVRSGARLRETRQEASTRDSLLATFERLTQSLVGPGMQTRDASAVSVNSVGAYQEYVAGSLALNRFDTGEARRRFEKALAIDSAFALAHYKLAVALRFDDAADSSALLAAGSATAGGEDAAAVARHTQRLRHAEAAARLASQLPPRERRLATGMLAMMRRDYFKACAEYSAIVRADSMDVDALYGLGDCLLADDVVEPVGPDIPRPEFRGNWNTAIAMMKRVLAVDPSYHLAFDAIVRTLTVTARLGCVPPPGAPCRYPSRGLDELPQDFITGEYPQYVAAAQRDGDTLIVTPRALKSTTLPELVAVFTQPLTLRASLQAALSVAQDWVDAGPTEPRARRALGYMQLRLGRYVQADTQLALAAVGDGDLIPRMYRVETKIKRGQGAAAIRLLDTLTARFASSMYGRSTAITNIVTGRFAALDSAMTAAGTLTIPEAMRTPQMLAFAFSAARLPMLITLGQGVDSANVARVNALMRGRSCTGACATTVLSAFQFGLRLNGIAFTGVPDSLAKYDARIAPAAALARSDMVALRVAAQRLDSIVGVQVRLYAPDDGSAMVAADTHLLLGDTTRALAAVRRMLDELLPATPAAAKVGPPGITAVMLWPRAMLLRADLAFATGQNNEATIWYRRFVDLWAAADPQFADVVARARAALR